MVSKMTPTLKTNLLTSSYAILFTFMYSEGGMKQTCTFSRAELCFYGTNEEKMLPQQQIHVCHSQAIHTLEVITHDALLTH